jgi:hypothetical protein
LKVSNIFNWSFSHTKSFDKGLGFMMVLKGFSDRFAKEYKSIWFPLFSSGWEVVISRRII